MDNRSIFERDYAGESGFTKTDMAEQCFCQPFSFLINTTCDF